jgi:hypothetical protein
MKLKMFVPFLLAAAISVDASAIPFFATRSGSAATAQAEGGNPALMADYSRDVSAGLSEFAFLSRNFAGANPGNGNGDRPGLIGPEEPDDPDNPAPVPGSIALMALGLAVLAWRYRRQAGAN